MPRKWRLSGPVVGLALLIPLCARGLFDFNVTALGDSPLDDIFLESIFIPGPDITVEDFSFVTAATIVENDPIFGANTGAASADIGDNATTGVVREDATAADIVTNLSNNNLNNIIDTEDDGNFVIDLFFDGTFDNLLVFERGINSQLGVQALDDQGNPFGNSLTLGTPSTRWFNTGLSIDTQEISGAQPLGAIGVSVARDLGIAAGEITGVRFTSTAAFNGPDWKFVGTSSDLGLPEIPEPSASPLVWTLGLLALLHRRFGGWG